MTHTDMFRRQVRSKCKNSYCHRLKTGLYTIYSRRWGYRIADGSTREGAWRRAAYKLGF